MAVECEFYDLLLGLVVASLLLLFVSKKLCVYTLVVVAVLSGLHTLRKSNLDAQKEAFVKARELTTQLTIIEKLRGGRYFVRVSGGEPSIQHAKLLYHSYQDWYLGDKIEGDFWIKRPIDVRNPGEFNAEKWMRTKAVSLQCSGYGKKVGESIIYRFLGGFTSFREVVKGRLVQGVEDEHAAKVIQSMFLGERFGNDDPVTTQFRLSGAMHVFAVSGLHVMLIAGAGLFLLRLLSLPPCILIPLVVLLMIGYTGLTGWGTPAIRATVMGSFFLGGLMFYRKANVLNTLAASSLFLLSIDSYQLLTVSFLLTYGVVLAIIIFTGFWERKFAFIDRIDPFLPQTLYNNFQVCGLKVRSYIKQSMAVSFAAWMGSAPLIAFYFKIFSPVSLLIGVPIVAMLTLIMWFGFLSVGVSFISTDLSVGVNRLNAQLAKFSYTIAGGAADLKYGHYVLAGEARESVEIFDVKSGGASFINLGDGVMLDCGGKATRLEVRNALRAFKRKVGEVWISHHDPNHYRGLDVVTGENKEARVMVPNVNLSHIFKNILTDGEYGLKEPGVLVEGYRKNGKDYVLEVLYDGSAQDSPSADDKSLVVKLRWKGCSILFVNDIGFYTESNMLRKGVDVSCDILVCGKHENQHSPHESFIKAAQPKVLIASSFRPSLSQQRSYQWRMMLEKNNVKIFNQSDCGAVSIRWESDRLVLDPIIGESVEVELEVL